MSTETDWRTISTSTWSDALDRLRIGGVVQGLAWRSGTPRLAGRAVTVQQRVAELGRYGRSAFDVGAMIRQAGPGDVLVVQMDGAAVSTFGGLAARAAAHRRIEGALGDGGCRDLDEIRALGFRICSRHVTPISGKERVARLRHCRRNRHGRDSRGPLRGSLRDRARSCGARQRIRPRA